MIELLFLLDKLSLCIIYIYELRLTNQRLSVSAHIEAHSWIEPHLFENLIQAQSKTDIKTIEPQLE